MSHKNRNKNDRKEKTVKENENENEDDRLKRYMEQNMKHYLFELDKKIISVSESIDLVENSVKSVENNKKDNIEEMMIEMKNSFESLADKVTKIHASNVNRDVNISIKLNDILKRMDEYEEAIQEGNKTNIIVKNKVENNSQMLKEIIESKSDIKGDDRVNDKTLDDIVSICCEMQSKIERNHEMLKDNDNENRQIKDKKQDKNKLKDERFQRFEKNMIKIEEHNIKIVLELEEKNEDLKNENIKLKDRIVNINKTKVNNSTTS